MSLVIHSLCLQQVKGTQIRPAIQLVLTTRLSQFWKKHIQLFMFKVAPSSELQSVWEQALGMWNNGAASNIYLFS